MRAILSLILCFGFGHTFSQTIVEIRNPSDYERSEVVAEIPVREITKIFPAWDSTSFLVINPQNGKQVPWQLEYKGEKQAQNLLVLINLKPKETIRIKIQKGKSKQFDIKTFGRFVPERKDDFAWENDRIAFRMYGKALEKFPNEMAYGTDVWVKRTNKLIIDKWYKLDNYHNDNGDGLDYYKVGFTLGAGDIAPYIHDTIRFSKNFSGWKMLDNGPLRTTFQLIYDAWWLPSQKVSCTKTISIDAGSQMNRIEVRYDTENETALPVVVGIVKRTEPGVEYFDEKNGVMAYWEPQHGKDGTTGVACIFPGKVKEMMMKQGHLLTFISAEPNQSVIYYNGAVWDKAGKISSADAWLDYLRKFKKTIQEPLNITVKKK